MSIPRILIVVLNVLFVVALLRGQYIVAVGSVVAELAVFLLTRSKAGAADPDMDPEATEPQRPLLEGTVEAAGLTWDVTEERRGGPWSQLLVLKARDAGSGVMHVRPPPGERARDLSQVEALASDPALRYLTGPDGTRWQARIVMAAGEAGMEIPLVKFISREGAVREGPFIGLGGLGQRTDEELRTLLERSDRV